ncbi:MAG: uroporphyrinogen decarboxylase, partial [Chloroflexota bacterium]|nr:uroporphyrinogen decarboxylase [Chloroflexota bacterium]
DWRVMLDDAWARIGYDRGIQGNLDPTVLLAPRPVIEEAARDVLHRAGGRAGHVFNLGHGVLPDTEPSLLAELVELVHAESRSANG